MRSWLGSGTRGSSRSTVVVVEVVLQGSLVGLTPLLILEKHLLNPDLLQDGRKLIVVEEVDHRMLQNQKSKALVIDRV